MQISKLTRSIPFNNIISKTPKKANKLFKFQKIRNFSTNEKHQDILSNMQPPLPQDQRQKLLFDSAIKSFKQPEEAQNISELGDLSSYYSLIRIREKMKVNKTGQQILQKQPRINTYNFQDNLKNLDPESFGYAYYKFMTNFNFNPEERPQVKYIPDYELAYIQQRYRETHDFQHVQLGCPDVTIKSELLVKWYEMSQLGLPSAALSSTFGLCLQPNLTEKIDYVKKLPLISKNAFHSQFFMNVMIEDLLPEKLSNVQNKLNISPI